MSISRNGDLVCSYCGSRYVLSDQELMPYREFRARMLSYLAAIANRNAHPEETDWIWERAETRVFRTAEGADLRINYIDRAEDDGITVFTARRNVLFLFPEHRAAEAARFTENVSRLAYPQADVRQLSQYFPEHTGSFTLSDGRVLLTIAKPEEVFPLSAFGRLPAVHAAWIVSRMENMCCVLAYSDLVHGGINPSSIFINAGTHEAYLLGGWWKAKSVPGGSTSDLADLRRTAKRLLGTAYAEAPAAFRRFLEEKPAKDAYTDFGCWDRVIEKGFGGRRFEKLELNLIV